MIQVLFVCMGNICRSPSAKAVFQRLVEEHSLEDKIAIDSAGTHAYHVGNKADKRSIQTALGRGIDLNSHRARQISMSDFQIYDYILVMDDENYNHLMTLCPEPLKPKIRYFLEFAPHLNTPHVPDPYYGGPQGFEHVLDLLEAASEGLLEDIRKHALSAVNE